MIVRWMLVFTMEKCHIVWHGIGTSLGVVGSSNTRESAVQALYLKQVGPLWQTISAFLTFAPRKCNRANCRRTLQSLREENYTICVEVVAREPFWYFHILDLDLSRSKSYRGTVV